MLPQNETFGQTSGKEKIIYKHSIEVRGSTGGFYTQYILNPIYSIVHGQREYSIGLLYKDLNFHYLLDIRQIEAESKCYGITGGYINNIKNYRGIRLRFETDMNLVIFTSNNVTINHEKINIRDVYTGILASGLNVKLPILKNIDMTFIIQLAIGTGFEGNGLTFFSRQHGSGFYLDEIHYLGVKYKF